MSYTILDTCTGCGACVRICPTQAVTGEKKKLHTISGDLCIECGACGRICPSSAVKDPSGNLCIMIKRSRWNRPVFNSDLCMSCAMCIDACPVHCLALSDAKGLKDPHGYPYLKEGNRCIGCGICEAECPVGAAIMTVPVREERETMAEAGEQAAR